MVIKLTKESVKIRQVLESDQNLEGDSDIIIYCDSPQEAQELKEQILKAQIDSQVLSGLAAMDYVLTNASDLRYLRKFRDVVKQKIKEIKEYQDTVTRKAANEEREKAHHNCFLDGKLSGYLWCIDEILNALKEINHANRS